MFTVYGWKCSSRKAIHNWVEKRGRSFADDEAETEVQKWLRQPSTDFYVAGIDAMVYRWDKGINAHGGSVEK
jgi:hypothetical protein